MFHEWVLKTMYKLLAAMWICESKLFTVSVLFQCKSTHKRAGLSVSHDSVSRDRDLRDSRSVCHSQ